MRHGTLSLYAALQVNTGEVQGMTAERHTAANFVEPTINGDRTTSRLGSSVLHLGVAASLSARR